MFSVVPACFGKGLINPSFRPERSGEPESRVYDSITYWVPAFAGMTMNDTSGIPQGIDPLLTRLLRYARALKDGAAILRKCPWGAITWSSKKSGVPWIIKSGLGDKISRNLWLVAFSLSRRRPGSGNQQNS